MVSGALALVQAQVLEGWQLLRVTPRHRLVFVYVYLALLPAGVEVLVHPPESVPVGYDMWAVLAASFLIDGAVLYRASNELATRAALTDVDLQQQGALSLSPSTAWSMFSAALAPGMGLLFCLDAAPRPGTSASTLTKLRAIFKHINVTQVGTVSLSLPTRFTACAATCRCLFGRACALLWCSQDPFLAAVFLEDFSATLGVVIAACGIGLTQLTG
jgi:hypothetical protein